METLDPFEYERRKAEQERLLVFQPLIVHSHREATAEFAFHSNAEGFYDSPRNRIQDAD